MNPSPVKLGRVVAFAVLVTAATVVSVVTPYAMDIGDWILFACGLAGAGFMVAYDLSTGGTVWHRGKWIRTREGRNIMSLSACIAAVVLLNVLANDKVFGATYFGRPALRIVVYVSLLAVVLQRIRWLLRAQSVPQLIRRLLRPHDNDKDPKA